MKEAEVEVMEPEATQLEKRESSVSAYHEERSVEEVVAQMVKVQQLMKSVLKKDEHYGVIPGTQKPSLLQPGVQKLCFMFRLVPRFVVERVDLPNDHREYSVRCQLIHAKAEEPVGEGVGLCSTMEAKYRWRKAERACPECGAETIKRSRYEDKDSGEKGWYCFAKIGGCGAKFAANDPAITTQEVGRKENPDIADTFNTVLKMAKKRAFVDACLTATAASDLFTQDVDETGVIGNDEPAKPPSSQPAPKPATSKKPDTITKSQQNELWKKAMDRSEETGATREQIMRDVLAGLELEGTAEIPASEFERVFGMINEWDPTFEVPEGEEF